MQDNSSDYSLSLLHVKISVLHVSTLHVLIKNFLLKDRGHILEITCLLYNEKMWKTSELEEIVLNEIKYFMKQFYNNFEIKHCISLMQLLHKLNEKTNNTKLSIPFFIMNQLYYR